jgi:hypothetical protein
MKGFLLCLVGIYLALAWVFESWFRPLVVMAVIPFGLIGTIWGHYQWDLAFSIFTVVGLIGMTGIIINNAIVLITTVDAYKESRATVPAVIAAAGDRLRPILLTSLTTVLGLAPLMFEKSRQALFLKPTVVTLVYGLGVGAILVLLVVPALLVVERDVRISLRGWRRGWSGGHAAGPTRLVRGATLVSLVWLAAVFAPLLWTGSLSGPVSWLATRLPGLSQGSVAMLALGAGLVSVVLGTLVLAGRLRPKRAAGGI